MKNIILVISLFSALLVIPSMAYAHCDTLDGPVINDARTALEQKDVTPVLKWIKISNEKEIKDIFNKTLAKITRNPNDKEAAEMEFFLSWCEYIGQAKEHRLKALSLQEKLSL